MSTRLNEPLSLDSKLESSGKTALGLNQSKDLLSFGEDFIFYLTIPSFNYHEEEGFEITTGKGEKKGRNAVFGRFCYKSYHL